MRSPSHGDPARDHRLVFVNPVILSEAGMQLSPDGCLSFPGLPLVTVRPTQLLVAAHRIDGTEFTLTIGEDVTSTDAVERVSSVRVPPPRAAAPRGSCSSPCSCRWLVLPRSPPASYPVLVGPPYASSARFGRTAMIRPCLSLVCVCVCVSPFRREDHRAFHCGAAGSDDRQP